MDLSSFYDDWATDYDAAHSDWRASVVEQGARLAEALNARSIVPPGRILDCTCGIGTQAIGLALAGYSVWASDLSPGEIERARLEAEAFGVDVAFAVADLVDLAATLPADESWRGFDGVVSANSLTHFSDRATLARVFAAMAGAARRGGVLAVTNRDYGESDSPRPTSTPVQSSVVNGVRRVSFQLWDWSSDGESYGMEDVLLTRAVDAVDETWMVRSHSTRLRAWLQADIEGAAFEAGLTEVEWTRTGHQPVATFRVP